MSKFFGILDDKSGFNVFNSWGNVPIRGHPKISIFFAILSVFLLVLKFLTYIHPMYPRLFPFWYTLLFPFFFLHHVSLALAITARPSCPTPP